MSGIYGCGFWSKDIVRLKEDGERYQLNGGFGVIYSGWTPEEKSTVFFDLCEVGTETRVRTAGNAELELVERTVFDGAA